MPRKRRDIPWLEWRGSVAYVCWYKETTRRTERLSLRTADAMEAQKRYAAFLVDGHDIIAGNPRRPSGLTVDQALDDYYREHVTKKVVDKRRIENCIAQLKGFFAKVPMHDVDIPMSRTYIDRRRMGSCYESARSREGDDGTIRRELGTLIAAANHAVRWKRLPRNELPVVELPAAYIVESLADDDWLTKDELRRAIDAATGDLRHFIVLAYDSASRRGAIETLRRSQVDLARSQVNLRGPDEDENQRRSRKRRPIVPISAWARPSYESLLNASPTQWLFGQPKSWYKEFRRNMESIGLGHKRNPHILRHSRATHLLQDGVNIYAVAKLLGDTVATVEKVYGHHSAEYLAEAMKATERGA